jgi:hypothetical protein
MSNPTTNYVTWNPNTNSYQDLSGIFQPYASGTKASNTGFTVAGYGDLSNIFAIANPPTYLSFNTNYITSSGTDLSQTFAPLPQFTYTGTYSTTSNSTYSLIIICTAGTGTFTNNYFNSPAFVNMVGGGGGGGAISTSRNGGGGGGGGAFYSDNITFTKYNSYNFTVGTGGTAGQRGGISSIQNVASVNGGSNGANASSTSGGNGGNSGNNNSGGTPIGVSGGGGGEEALVLGILVLVQMEEKAVQEYLTQTSD